jgi:hypothetical protein
VDNKVVNLTDEQTQMLSLSSLGVFAKSQLESRMRIEWTNALATAVEY